VFAPHSVCASDEGPCTPDADYDGEPVVENAEVRAIVDKWVAKAGAVRDEKLGVVLESELAASYGAESPLGNWVADLMLAARPKADVAITNGGGLRANLAPGELTFGALYRVMPFDNRFALVTMSGAELAKVVADNLTSRHGIFSYGGVRATAHCTDGVLGVVVTRVGGKPIAPNERVVVATSDFLATGGDPTLGEFAKREGTTESEDDPTIREAVVEVLRKRSGSVRADDERIYSGKKPRISFPGSRPVQCK
jgi:2',3'-cyclic-nucleotide 2'-phosphodiesterase (5'-nucleotidase family)